MNDPSSSDPTQHSVPPDFAGNVTPRDMLMPALRSDPESFPVLKAFQDYIEAERERARRRLVTVSAIAITAIVLVVAAFLAVGTAVIGNLMRRNDQLQDVVMRAAVRDATATAPVGHDGGRAEELAHVEATLRRMQAENAALQGRMTALQDLPAALATTMGQTISNLVASASATAAPRALPPAPATPFAPSNVLALNPSPALRAPAPAAPVLRSSPSSVGSTATAVTSPSATGARATTEAPTTVSVPTRIQAAPRIDGYAPARMTLVTDRGFAIPWRIVVPE
jgi:hypothetical protein